MLIYVDYIALGRHKGQESLTSSYRISLDTGSLIVHDIDYLKTERHYRLENANSIIVPEMIYINRDWTLANKQ